MGDDRGGRKTRSPQSKQLRRRLSLSLALRWVVYTVAFVVLAVLLNAAMVPQIAEMVADETSEWRTWRYDDYPLERCLAVTGEEFIAVTDTIEEAGFLATELNQPHEERYALSDEADGVVAEDVDDGVASAVERILVVDVGESPESIIAGVTDPTTPIVVRQGDGVCTPFSLRSYQQMAIERDIAVSSPTYGASLQVMYTEEGVAERDLAFYNVAKRFKLPVGIALYLVGCIVLIFSGYGRAMRYFDELSGAVGGLIADKEKPIVLSQALKPTQNELNAIRLASLADERAAQHAERRKDELVAYLAHDVKTPLTSVIGYLMLLEEAPDMPDAQRQRYVATAAGKAQRLEGLVDEFFEITRYNLQSIPVERSNVDARLLLEQVADEFYPDSQARGLRLEVDVPQDSVMFVDPGKFARALGNVVRNAVAYADRDSAVTLSACVEEGEWCIRVSNHGREISEAHLKSIFEKFYREDAARGSSSGGAGLGLAIAKEIVVSHGGAIDAQSELGVTTFTIRIPLPPPAAWA